MFMYSNSDMAFNNDESSNNKIYADESKQVLVDA